MLYETFVLSISSSLHCHAPERAAQGFLLPLGSPADHHKIQVKAICRSNGLAESQCLRGVEGTEFNLFIMQGSLRGGLKKS